MANATAPAPIDTESPFDAICQPCPQGGEDLWSTRVLQEMMGYPRWNEFEPVIERAKAAAHNQGFNPKILFRVNTEKSGGRPRVDYLITRFAAYLISMNGDPRKPEVAAAQAYFAIRTREAETRPAPTALPDRRALAQMVIDAEDGRALAEAKVAELEPSAAAWDALGQAAGDYSLREAAQILSRDPAIATGQNRLNVTLAELGMVDKTGQPYQKHINHLVRRPRSYDHPRTGEPQLTHQIRITVPGLTYLHQKLGGVKPLRLDEVQR
ncbi:phage antirepressor KilAC domain-containing protein [Rhodococcus daqingensis]|uniref:Phage antirepressor KilAC domain-containing protein n=1 Tax=Rhodococcus daqingensis TaxID=2479363 RepID=A0ABW2S3E0_9NOCA